MIEYSSNAYNTLTFDPFSLKKMVLLNKFIDKYYLAYTYNIKLLAICFLTSIFRLSSNESLTDCGGGGYAIMQNNSINKRYCIIFKSGMRSHNFINLLPLSAMSTGYNLHSSIIRVSALDAMSIISRPGKLLPCLTLTNRINLETISGFSQFSIPNDCLLINIMIINICVHIHILSRLIESGIHEREYYLRNLLFVVFGCYHLINMTY